MSIYLSLAVYVKDLWMQKVENKEFAKGGFQLSQISFNLMLMPSLHDKLNNGWNSK